MTDIRTAGIVAEIFEDLLGVGPVGLDEDFFELGGHSLLAVELTARVNAAFGSDMTVSALFDSDDNALTPVALSGMLGDSRPPHSALVNFGATGGPALVCVPPAGGTALSLREFAGVVAADADVSVLRYPPVAPGETQSIESLADRLIAALPDAGPPTLLGWSMGGIVAFEAARRLTAAGRPPAGLILVDSYPAGTTGDADDLGLVEALVEQLRVATGRPITVDRERASSLPVMAAVELVLASDDDLSAEDRDLIRTTIRTLQAHITAATEYAVRPYGGRVTLIQAERVDAGARAAAGRAWSRVCPRLDTVTLPGEHLTLFQAPYVTALAKTVIAGIRT